MTFLILHHKSKLEEEEESGNSFYITVLTSVFAKSF